MDHPQPSADPFRWDVDTVATFLSSSTPPCHHEPPSLAAKVREEAVDGRTLLIYEFLYSKQEVLESLGIRAMGHKATFACLVRDLRSRSQAFCQWKNRLLEGEETGVEYEANDIPHLDDNPAAPASPAQVEPGLKNAELKRKAENLGQKSSNSPETFHDALPSISDDHQPRKRTRVAPEQLSGLPEHKNLLAIPTEADFLIERQSAALLRHQGDGSFAWESAGGKAYLGEGAIAPSAIRSPHHPLSSYSRKGSGATFFIVYPSKLPSGRRMVVSRVMKRLLYRNGRKEAHLAAGMTRVPSSERSDEEDTVLGLDDLPDSLEDKVLQEVEAEKAENERLKTKNRALGYEKVVAELREATEAYTRDWQERKLPKHQRQEFKIWTDARKAGRRSELVLTARWQARFFDERIKKLTAEILRDTWFKKSEVRAQASSLEQSLHDKLHNLWLADMLDSRTEPPRPESLPKRKRPPPRTRSMSPQGTELLTSSDEDDFIVLDNQDELPVLPNASSPHGSGASTHEPSTAVKQEFFPKIDLTENVTPQRPRHREGSIIDLTRSEAQSSVPPMLPTPEDHQHHVFEEDFEPVEEIGRYAPTYWARLKDRSRLVICLLWHLRHARRQSILLAAARPNQENVFASTVNKQLTEPLEDVTDEADPEKLLAFDMTRLFLSYIKVRDCKPNRIVVLADKDRVRLERGKRRAWGQLCQLINKVGPDFPQDSQIFRTDTFELDMAEASDLEPDDLAALQDTPSKSRRHAPKEIVQSRAAVDLRLREKRRLEEQEARRAKLRTELDTFGLISNDQSRLIINEAKQDDQPFIYINQDTGQRIKDHQIQGVRFLWNSVIPVDKCGRTGCLLAHTMGLGKTMQVITFLVAVQEAAKSPDPAVVSQIPEDLRPSRTLILCPSSVVDNWMDELLMWAPEGLLGHLRKIDAQLTTDERRLAVRAWATEGGVLVIGYTMLSKISGDGSEVEDDLSNHPNIVIADEAHKLKNPDSIIHRVCSRFRANCRIAMTGSPLANNVEEYFFMINWVAPNFLGSLGEFRDMYAKTIHTGLWCDSLPSEKRKAVKMLQVLKETVAPKVHRASTKSCLKDDLTPKYEFMLYVKPTQLQAKLYEIYLSALSQEGTASGVPQAQLFGIVNDLRLICNHPRCLRQMARDYGQGDKSGVQGDAEAASGTFTEGLKSAVLTATNGRDPDNPGLSVKTLLLVKILDEARSVGDKVLVFSHSIPTLDLLSNLLQMQKRRVCRLDGKTPISLRQSIIKDFNTGDREVYLISTNAGGTGFNIQGANRVVIFDFGWNPVNEQQAIGRAYRLGQEKPVFVYRFVVAGTFEQDLQNKAIFKTQLASRVVDKKNPIIWSNRLDKLIHPIRPVAAQKLSCFLRSDCILDKLIQGDEKARMIRQIVSTDTFEEEDVDDKLTAEERKDAEDMVRLNQLRFTDPAAYEKGQKERRKSQYMAAAGAAATSSALAEVSRPGERAMGPAPPAALKLKTAAPQKYYFDLNSASPREQTDAPLGAVTAAPGAATASSGSAAPAPSHQQRSLPAGPSAATPATAPLVPMTGANTRIGQPVSRPPSGSAGSSTGKAPAAASTVISPGLAATVGAPAGPGTPILPPPPTSPGFPQVPAPRAQAHFQNPIFGKGKKRVRELLAEKLQLPFVRYFGGAAQRGEDVCTEITEAIDAERTSRAYGYMQDEIHWVLLRLLLDDNRFLMATLNGYFSTAYLAHADEQDLRNRMKLLRGMSEADFTTQLVLKQRRSDPVNLQNIQRASPLSERTAGTHQLLDDMRVMREAATMRRERSEKLTLQPVAHEDGHA